MQEELCWWIFTSFKRERLGNERISGTDKGCRKQHANGVKCIIVLQWALLSGIHRLVEPLGLLEYAWDKAKRTIKKYKKEFMDNQWTASTIISLFLWKNLIMIARRRTKPM